MRMKDDKLLRGWWAGAGGLALVTAGDDSVATAMLHLVVSVIPTAFGAFGIKRAVFRWFLSFPRRRGVLNPLFRVPLPCCY